MGISAVQLDFSRSFIENVFEKILPNYFFEFLSWFRFIIIKSGRIFSWNFIENVSKKIFGTIFFNLAHDVDLKIKIKSSTIRGIEIIKDWNRADEKFLRIESWRNVRSAKKFSWKILLEKMSSGEIPLGEKILSKYQLQFPRIFSETFLMKFLGKILLERGYFPSSFTFCLLT